MTLAQILYLIALAAFLAVGPYFYVHAANEGARHYESGREPEPYCPSCKSHHQIT